MMYFHDVLSHVGISTDIHVLLILQCNYLWINERVISHILGSSLFELLVWPHEVEPCFHSWYRGRVEIIDANITSYLQLAL